MLPQEKDQNHKIGFWERSQTDYFVPLSPIGLELVDWVQKKERAFLRELHVHSINDFIAF